MNRVKILESLKNFESMLKEKYDESTKKFDLRKKQELEEKQQIFQEAFRNDLEVFKNSGTLPSKSTTPININNVTGP